MSNSPPVSSSAVTTASSTTSINSSYSSLEAEKVHQWILELSAPETREAALLELSKKREAVADLAPMLWHSFGTMAALLQVRTVIDGRDVNIIEYIYPYRTYNALYFCN